MGLQVSRHKVLVMRKFHTKRMWRAFGAMLLVSGLFVSTLATPNISLAAPSQDRLETARARLQDLEAEGELIIERYNLASSRLDQIRSQIVTAEQTIDDVTRRMATRHEDAVRIATELYKGGSAEGIEAVLSSKSLADIEQRIRYLESSQDASSAVFEELAADRKLLDQKVADLENAREEAADTEAHLADLRDQIESKMDSQRAEITRLNAEIEAAERRAAARRAAAEEAARDSAAPTLAPAPPPPSGGGSAPTVHASNPNAQAAVDAALSQVGKPYQWGAAGPNSYDCSGLTMWAWAHAGVSLPHNSGAQYAGTPRVSQGDWQPGDLLFYGSPIHHVGMYIGNGQVVEAPYTGTTVRIAGAYRSDYVGAGRPGV